MAQPASLMVRLPIASAEDTPALLLLHCYPTKNTVSSSYVLKIDYPNMIVFNAASSVDKV